MLAGGQLLVAALPRRSGRSRAGERHDENGAEGQDEEADPRVDRLLAHGVVERHVGRRVGVGGDEAELRRRLALDARVRRRARELGPRRGDVCLQLGARAADELVELDVEPQDEDVDRDDAGEERADDDDPEDRSAERDARAARTRRCVCLGDGRHRRRYALTAARRRADADRGFSSTSRCDGRTGFRVSDPQRRLLAADADREVGRARASLRLLRDEALHDPVLERVERDHREPAARPQHLERRGKRRLEGAELVVHGDAQGLEDALRRMPFAEPRRGRDRELDHVDELAGARERRLLASADDRPRDRRGEPLLPVAPEDRHELALVPGVDDRRRGRLGGRDPSACRAARRSRRRIRAPAGRSASTRCRGRAGSHRP